MGSVAYFFMGLFMGSLLSGVFLCIFIGGSCDR